MLRTNTIHTAAFEQDHVQPDRRGSSPDGPLAISCRWPRKMACSAVRTKCSSRETGIHRRPPQPLGRTTSGTLLLDHYLYWIEMLGFRFPFTPLFMHFTEFLCSTPPVDRTTRLPLPSFRFTDVIITHLAHTLPVCLYIIDFMTLRCNVPQPKWSPVQIPRDLFQVKYHMYRY